VPQVGLNFQLRSPKEQQYLPLARDFPAGRGVVQIPHRYVGGEKKIMAAIDIDFGGSITEMFDGFLGFVPALVGAILIFVIGSFIAKFLRGLIGKVLGRLGVDRLVDRSGLGGPLERAGYPDAGKFLAQVLYIMIMLVVASLAIQTLGISQLQDLFDRLIAWIPSVFIAMIILFATGAIANFVKGLVGGMTQHQSWGNLATNVVTGAIWFLGATMAWGELGIGGNVIDTLVQAVLAALSFIIAIKFGVGGIWAARDRFWPGVYDKVGSASADTTR